MSWALNGLNRLLETNDAVGSALDSLVGSCLDISTSFSGVDAPGFSARVCANAISKQIHAANAFRVRLTSACEKNRACIEELLNAVDGPEHVFSDMLSVLPQETIDASRSSTTKDLRRMVLKAKLNTTSWCCRHGRTCSTSRAAIHVAGTPCTDHSSYGSRLRDQGKCYILYLAWIAQRRLLRETIIIHENVTAFGSDWLERDLGDLYLIICETFDPQQFGFPSKRPRNFSLMLLRSELPRLGVNTSFKQQWRPFIENAFGRQCGISLDAFLIASDMDLKAEREWAMARTTVKQRPDTHR